MAANSKGRAIAGVFGKRVATQIWAKDSAPLPVSLRRVAHSTSSYDKNVEDQVRPAVVPDNVIASESDKYWGPNPKTGVFGPEDPRPATAGFSGAHTAAAAAAAGEGSSSSVLDQSARFRPLEDVEKPDSH